MSTTNVLIDPPRVRVQWSSLTVRTKKLPASDQKGARIRAWFVEGPHVGTVTIPWPYDESTTLDAHLLAARKLIEKNGQWHRTKVAAMGGRCDQTGYIFLFS